MSFNPTPEQTAIVDAHAAASGHSIMVEAYAGCAKSSTLELASGVLRTPTLICAFNRSTAKDMTGRLASGSRGSQFLIKTMNGLGHTAWARALSIRGINTIKLEEKKRGRITSEVCKPHNCTPEQWDAIRDMTRRAYMRGLVPAALRERGIVPSTFIVSEGLTPDTDDTWADFAWDAGADPEDVERITDLARSVMDQSIREATQGIINYDDQIYCSVFLGGKFPIMPRILVDEGQDLSPINREQVRRSLAPGGLVTIVGDQRQSIYAFRGADHRSLANLRSLASGWQDLPLHTTFRCPKAIVARNQVHAPGFTAWDSNPAGEFLDWTNQPWTASQLRALRRSPDDTFAVLCRNNAPIMKMGLALLRQGIPSYVLGKDLSKSLIALTKKLAKDDQKPLTALSAALDRWENNELANAALTGKQERNSTIVDRAECLRALIDGLGGGNAGDLRGLITRLLSREHGEFALGTIHAAKGLEWTHVVHLDPWRLPSRQAREAYANGDSAPMEQENNLRYVCETRTRHTLINASQEGFA